MANRRLLISYAHPDDESFGLGALISRYVAEGVEVYLICATNGDAGTVKPEYLEGYDSIQDLRLAELDCASEILGFEKVFKLGYRDSGMMGTEANDDPDCLWYQWRHQPDDVTRRVVEVIREVRPHVVLTFNEYGGYGHPDHIAIQQATVAALGVTGASDYPTSDYPPYQPQKLYYTSIPKLTLQIAIWSLRLKGKNPREVGVNKDIDLVKILDHVLKPTTRVNIQDYYAQWEAASACHVSQGGGGGGMSRYPMWLRRMLAPTQGFTRIYPDPGHSRVDEYDLFENVTVDDPAPEPA